MRGVCVCVGGGREGRGYKLYNYMIIIKDQNSVWLCKGLFAATQKKNV